MPSAPGLLCLPPSVLDQTFPRTLSVLERVGVALGVLQEKIEEGSCKVLFTPVLSGFVETFEWQGVQSYPILQAVYALLVEWLLKPGQASVSVAVGPGLAFVPHPIPNDSGEGVLIEIWREEVGRLFTVHRSSCAAGFCVGVACDFAFAGYPKGDYEPPVPGEAFPLVGPDDITSLLDFEIWDVPEGVNRAPIGYSEAKKNIPVLNGTVSSLPRGVTLR